MCQEPAGKGPELEVTSARHLSKEWPDLVPLLQTTCLGTEVTNTASAALSGGSPHKLTELDYIDGDT